MRRRIAVRSAPETSSQGPRGAGADPAQPWNQALGDTPAVHDLNQDGIVNVVDIQIVLSGAIGLGCTPR